MSARRLSALIWLDWKLFVNRIRSIRRNPRRLIPWLIFLIWLIPSFINRLVIGSNLGRGPALRTLAPLVAPLGDFVPGLAALALGFAIWRASDRPPAAFQSPADARFVIGAGLDSRAVFTWLSLRTARRLIVGFLLLLVLFQVLYLPWLGFNLLNALAFTVALATFGGIVFGARLLAFNLKRKVPWLPVGGFGWLTGIAGTGAAMAMLVEISGTATMPAPIERISAALPPGSWMLSAFHGDLAAELLLLVFAVGFTVVGIALAGDCYPELWETSSRVFAMRQALRSRGGMFGYLGARPADSRQNVRQGARERRARSSSGQRVPGGALIVFWTEWQSLKRGRGGVPLQLAVVAAAGVVGVLVGLAAAKGLAAGGIIAANVVLLLVVWSWALSVQLGRDLGNPLWWLSSSPLWSRLAVWTLARGLRFAVPLILFIEVAIAVFGRYEWVLAVAPWPPLLLCWLTQAIGLAGYAFLPARSDYRLALTVRMFAIYAIFVPLALAAIPGAVLRSPALLVALPTLLAATILVGLIAFATWRIEGNGLAFAQEERQ